MTEKIKFYDPESGAERAIEVEKTVSEPGGQIWKIGSTGGVDWAVPVAFPNNAAPVCRESEPEEYARLAELEH